MQAVMRYEGDTIEHTPASAVDAGDVVVLTGDVALIATRDIAANEKGTLNAEGVFDVVKATGAIGAGDQVFWDAAGDPVSGTAGTGAAKGTGTVCMGFAVIAALSGDETVRVKLTAANVNSTTIAGAVTADSITGSDSSLGIVGKTAGPGGAVILAGGDGQSGSDNGGAVSVYGGNAAGLGTDGAVNIGTTNSGAINIGAASIQRNMAGVQNVTAGASTAAAGSTTADAGVLPAGTQAVYPTTAADGTKGVRMHASDKVTGRLVHIGNGVSNQVLKVYPASGGTINGAAADAAYSGGSGKGVIMYCLDSTANTWLAWG